jgi:uncharacterized protein (TIGR02246 family)
MKTWQNALMLLVLGGCTTLPAGDPATEIRAALETTAAGWNAGDLPKYLSMYDPSVVSNGAKGFVDGVEGVTEVMRAGFWKTGRPLQQLHYEHLNVRMLGGDFALVTGQYVLTGGERPERTGWFTTVWKRTAAGWRMIHDHS